MTAWHTFTTSEAVTHLRTDRDQGLSDQDVALRLEEYGPNQLEETEGRHPLSILAAQFTEVMVIILIIAAVVSYFIGDLKDTVAILIIVILNATLGFSQEFRAERAMAALKKLVLPIVKVRRNGEVQEVLATNLVPGDFVLLETGGRVPADMRLLEASNLRVDESTLTGESVPVEKIESPLGKDNLPIADQRNMVFMGTAVTYGRGSGVVVETGMRSQLGLIAHMLQSVKREQTPLQRRMDQLGKGLAVAALVLVAMVFAAGLWRGQEPELMFLTAISLAVAAVPEGLPAVVTIALALGAQRMARRNALIRKLPAVETLGSVTTICSDKTGTLTENRMTVTILDVAGRTVDLVQQMHEKMPSLASDEEPLVMTDTAIPVDASTQPALALLLIGGSLCNDATLEAHLQDAASTTVSEQGGFHAVGDPTEGAIVVAAARMGLWKAEIEKTLPRIAEVPFSSERKRMTTIHQVGKGVTAESDESGNGSLPLTYLPVLSSAPYIAFTKGAVDCLLEVSNRVWADDHTEPLDGHWSQRIQAANDQLAEEGIRVLGVGFRPLEALPESISEAELERGLVFVGMVGMIDPPRSEVKKAIAACRTAGIRPVMITGDHPLTALHIAEQLGMTDGSQPAVTGQELSLMSMEDLENIVQDVAVYARVSPEHKLKIVQALQDEGHIVAMTGDGVNDAPALKKADIGVAMGITGTDVSKEAADMILADDNFATIVAAAEEGRTIYDNIRKFIKYTLSSNVGEIVVMLLAPLLGLPVPLLPLQVLWINLVTDGLPGLALGVEPAEPDIMQRSPHPPNESIFARGMWQYILWVGVLMGLVSLAVQSWGYSHHSTTWQTMVFTTLCLSQMGNALTIRSEKRSLLSIGLFSNPALVGAVLLTLILQMAVIYIPFLQTIFKTVALNPAELGISLALSTIVFIVAEAVKLISLRSARAKEYQQT